MNCPIVMRGSTLIYEEGDDLEDDMAASYASNMEKVSDICSFFRKNKSFLLKIFNGLWFMLLGFLPAPGSNHGWNNYHSGRSAAGVFVQSQCQTQVYLRVQYLKMFLLYKLDASSFFRDEFDEENEHEQMILSGLPAKENGDASATSTSTDATLREAEEVAEITGDRKRKLSEISSIDLPVKVNEDGVNGKEMGSVMVDDEEEDELMVLEGDWKAGNKKRKNHQNSE